MSIETSNYAGLLAEIAALAAERDALRELVSLMRNRYDCACDCPDCDSMRRRARAATGESR